MYSFDFETYLFGPGLIAPKAVCASIGTATEEICLTASDALYWLAANLPTEIITTCNGPFDMLVAINDRPSLTPLVFEAYREGRIRDVQTRQALIDIYRGCLFRDWRSGGPLKDVDGKVTDRYSLGTLADIVLGIHAEKGEDTWRKRFAELDGIPISEYPPEAIRYMKQDARLTFDIDAAQEGGPNLSEAPRTDRAKFALRLACSWGMRTDPIYVARFEEAVIKGHIESRRKYYQTGIIDIRACGIDQTPDEISPEEAGDVRQVKGRGWRYGVNTKFLKDLVTKAYLGSPPLTETGDVSYSRDTLAESGDPLLEDFAETGANEKLFSTYLPILKLGTEIPICSEANVLVDTGRTSWRKPNLQNLPREYEGRPDVRQCFVPRDGYVFCSVDYGAVELVTLAQTCIWMLGWSRLGDALREGKDPHAVFAANMAGVSYDVILDRLVKKEKEAKDLRQFGKIADFGFPGGMGAEKLVWSGRTQGVRFCELLGMTCGAEKVLDRTGKPMCVECRKIAYQLRDIFFSTWLEMREYLDRVGDETSDPDGGMIQILPDGIIRGKCGYNAGANTRFQGLAARVTKEAFWQVSEEAHTNRHSPLWGTHPVVMVHDEIFAEIPEANQHEGAYRIADIMVRVMREHCPDVPVKAVPAIAKRWYKKMDTVLVDGRLVCWEPQ